ncbi:MAG: hypothetical protein R3B90_00605 [Planctomycetaceae bacterium]
MQFVQQLLKGILRRSPASNIRPTTTQPVDQSIQFSQQLTVVPPDLRDFIALPTCQWAVSLFMLEVLRKVGAEQREPVPHFAKVGLPHLTEFVPPRPPLGDFTLQSQMLVQQLVFAVRLRAVFIR